MLSVDELFKGRHFEREIIILCVRWYLRYKLSFRDLVEMMADRSLLLAHTTVMRWVQRYAPEFEKRWNRFACPVGGSWRVDETPTLDALNARLANLCRARQKERAGRNEQTIGERLVADAAALRELPTEPFEACHKQATKASSLALVRYRTNDYSVPTAYGFRDVLVKGFVDEVVIFCEGVEIARHARSYGRDDFVFEPRHYLALLEQKPGALDQAAPLQGWALPETLADLRRLMEGRMGRRGKREFIQVLRLTEVFSETIVIGAALEAIRLGAIGFDAVKQLVIARVETRPARLDLSAYPYLPSPDVRTTQPADYLALVSRAAA